MDNKLPPLPQEVFDGEKYTAPIPMTDPLPKCTHKEAKITNNELRCGCGASWTGPNLQQLHSLLTK